MLDAAKTLGTLSDTNQLLQPLPIARQDEVGQLIGAFNRLLEALGKREEALRESERRSRAIIETSPVPLATADEHGNVTFLNAAFVREVGYTVQDIPTLEAWKSRAYPEPQYRQWVTDNWQKQMEQAKHTSQPFASMELEIRRKDDSVRTFITSAAAAGVDFAGSHLVALYDVTERKRAEQALRDSAEKLRLFADNVPAMTVSYDENLHCRFANKAYAEFFGFSVENILGKHLREIVGEEVFRKIEGHFVQVLQGHPVTFQRKRKRQNGEPLYLETKLLPHIGERGDTLGCFAVATDISEHKLAEERIQHIAHHDGLTGLPNRLLFNDRLDQAISLAKRDSHQLALLYLDLDKFKAVNDTLGHLAGDELLQGVAMRIRREIRASDTVARIGGDEFTVILSDIAGRENAETVARKILAALATPFQLGSQKQSVSIATSIGIALYPADARDADALVKAADSAMYSAKQAGSSFRFCAA
jgi:diguanylate cyclase (GGDEF)-like protein/PAS domain S-box-containing protein